MPPLPEGRAAPMTHPHHRPRLPLVRQRRRRQRHHDDDRPRRDRPARPQRRRQVHPHQHDGRLPRALHRLRHPRRRRTIWRNEQIYRHIGIVPEREAMYDFLTGARVRRRQRRAARPARPGRRRRAGRWPPSRWSTPQDRKIATYSKGMRQRVKMASALVHDPSVLLLDEPFNGMDPRQRLQLMDLLRRMGDEGRTVLFSSHILEEVEQLAAPHRGGGGRAARRLRRLPQDPPADDGPPAPLPRPVQRRPGAGRGADRGRVDRRASRLDRRRRRAAHPGGRLRPASPSCCRGSPASTASGSTRSRRPTSPWRASSPTWSRREGALQP